ncbi:MAG: hypothetical protein EA384_09600 [Spirochaetaceae bacterium]|nr:MAG: hypothetical protein EA384_09600 [Spirochaetaceae bacterium]
MPQARARGTRGAIATLEARPRLTRGIQAACSDLRLQRLWLICPGNRSYLLNDLVHVVAMRDFAACAGLDPVEFRPPLRHT